MFVRYVYTPLKEHQLLIHGVLSKTPCYLVPVSRWSAYTCANSIVFHLFPCPLFKKHQWLTYGVLFKIPKRLILSTSFTVACMHSRKIYRFFFFFFVIYCFQVCRHICQVYPVLVHTNVLYDYPNNFEGIAIAQNSSCISRLRCFVYR